ncbi:molybdopterin-guanine dinucleotide biosynthesis protein MobA [Actinoalloteichus sp. AHMU CJ021]|uniref:molybdenum cofactor guanylyltransferase n=1 Tax=Actinoalloteichus TaxID=65496 RepID=UPI0004BEAB1E|nr:NTP transferase domain-containing protein [Actinoalloteichus caeruleus]AUS81946.1 molybdopterin-guanine dinucleotide biosynthesis protein MobA [Actinoalloteichus sp. AHMU CJ021]
MTSAAPVQHALVLAGGGSRRFGGGDKTTLRVGGATLLDRVLGAVPTGTDTVVVGPERPTGAVVRWTRERPPGGGPVAGIAAGLHLLPPADSRPGIPLVALLAADHPFLTPGTLHRLAVALVGTTGSGAVLVDDAGRRQWLVSLWRLDALRSAVPEDPAHAALRSTLGALPAVDVPSVGAEAFDVDDREAAARADELA